MSAVWLAQPAHGTVVPFATRDTVRAYVERLWRQRLDLGITRWRWSGASWELIDRDLGNVGNVRRAQVRGGVG